jgi:hypothetical protein
MLAFRRVARAGPGARDSGNDVAPKLFLIVLSLIVLSLIVLSAVRI